MIKLDYSISTMEERTAYVKKLLSDTPKDQQKPALLEYLSNYIIEAMPKSERKSRKITTDNRMVTIDRHETSFEGLTDKFESNTDAVYDLITDNTNQYLIPKIEITPRDLAEVPGLAELVQTISKLEDQYKKASGKRKYMLKKTIIEFRRNQYLLKQNYYQPMSANAQRTHPNIDAPAFDESYTVSGEEILTSGNLSLGDPAHVSLLLCNYSELKQDTYDKFNSDMYYILQDLEDCIEASLPSANPLYYEILILKIDGLSNAAIHDALLEKFNRTFTPEYISVVWRQKIPKIIAEAARRKYLDYYYTEIERGRYKRCSCCGQIKLIHPLYFSKNCTSKDGFYSICKECRSRKQRLKKEKAAISDDESKEVKN